MIPAVMPTYGRWDVAVERGEGPHLYATDGRKFLDFTSGIAVTGLGHCHPHVVAAVTEQAKRLWHTSNLFRIPGQEKLAQRLEQNAGDARGGLSPSCGRPPRDDYLLGRDIQ